MESPRTPGGHAAPVELVESPRGEGTELGNEWVRAYASKSIPKSISGTFFSKTKISRLAWICIFYRQIASPLVLYFLVFAKRLKSLGRSSDANFALARLL